MRLPKSVRSIGRVQTIAQVLTRHGFGHLVDRLNLRRFVPLPRRWRPAIPVEEAAHPSALGQRLVRVCEDLGPTFVKLGQVVASRPDLLPGPLIAELRQLQDQVAPFDSAIAYQVIADELGAPVEECFAEIAPMPFASGSIAQAYHARTPKGHDVVVKVRRPGIDETVLLDIHILRWIAEAAEGAIPELRPYQPTGIVEEFARTMTRELDFVNEAAATSRFAQSFPCDPQFRVPQVYWELTGTRVLTLQRLPGRSLREVLATPGDEYDRAAIAERIAKSFLRQVVEVGLFHADPHAGNLLLVPPASVGLIDFGMVGQVDDELRGHMVVALVAAVNKEVDIVIDVLADVGALGSTTNRSLLRRDLRELIEKYYGLPLRRMDLQTIFGELTELVRHHGVTLPRDFVLLGKSMVTVAGVCLELDPELNVLELIRPRIREMILERFAPARLARTAGMSAWHALNILRTGPGVLRDLLRRVEKGEWRINLQHQNIEQLTAEMDRSSNRLAFSILIAAIILGSSLLVGVGKGAEVYGIPLPLFGLAGYLVAGMMGMWLGIAILRSGKL